MMASMFVWWEVVAWVVVVPGWASASTNPWTSDCNSCAWPIAFLNLEICSFFNAPFDLSCWSFEDDTNCLAIAWECDQDLSARNNKSSSCLRLVIVSGVTCCMGWYPFCFLLFPFPFFAAAPLAPPPDCCCCCPKTCLNRWILFEQCLLYLSSSFSRNPNACLSRWSKARTVRDRVSHVMKQIARRGSAYDWMRDPWCLCGGVTLSLFR